VRHLLAPRVPSPAAISSSLDQNVPSKKTTSRLQRAARRRATAPRTPEK
jgi:hypothetical protein